MVNVDKLCRFEAGLMRDHEVDELFQELLDDGTVWSLQGFYGRTAQRLIDEGRVVPPEPRGRRRLTPDRVSG